MNEKQMTPVEAFTDFLKWVHVSGVWATLAARDRNRIINARRDKELKRGERHRLGVERIKKILGEYAPGRYTFIQTITVTVNE